MKRGICWCAALILGFSCCAKSAPSRTLAVTLTAPDRAWSLTIEQVRMVKGELWVLARLSRQDGMAAQVLSPVSDQVQVAADPALPVRYFVVGKTWGWGASEGYTFLDDRKALPPGFAAGELIFEQPGDSSSPVSSFPETTK